MRKLTALIILDGWGIGKDYYGNAVSKANTYNYDFLIRKFPNTALEASGLSVGLPEGQMGNSEVGHTNIGAGRIINQELVRITRQIENKEFFKNSTINNLVDYVNENNKTLHLFGLLSDGGVHSHIKHLFGILELCKQRNVKDVQIHCFMDGRDVSPISGISYIKMLQDKINELGVGKISTIMGRYYAMDRDKRWERIEEAYDALTKGVGIVRCDACKAIEESYDKKITDEFIKPILIEQEDSRLGIVKEDDGIIFYNYRPDRARQITRTFVDDEFDGFERNKLNVKFVCMTQYDKTIENVEIAFKPQPEIENTLGEYVSKMGLQQLRIAETEKYAHVTFFFNGGIEAPYENEDRILISSPKVATYDLQPEMSAIEVKNEIIKQIEKSKYDLMIINFANPDMVGHTGDINATMEAIEIVDKCLGEIVNLIIKTGGKAVITADHGNCEVMIDESTALPITKHTTNKVPLIIVDRNKKFKLRQDGVLGDIAPTVLELLGLKKPVEMTGNSLIIH
ncbi:2,3-bisphosphoglycerate-independent phosphoglycerate mutase [Sedimentibacter sp. zth1]|uniref:2,3-bisphosphoglycerate-independent phosphoglycerate mutase n=1 Tax=Sedimentibacter sp. zth1 TaxID=2816908 RepID=UPI001A9355C7|nr:2,3-bisphosphoglycerate-independent phosphoglycerate mutase [Sedimentibacter sp. zth1]QSX06239.1 2,3-bisphosphoglycerate-independent phosphoglycerate mutase [Sedimentibacter sp. zth1]